MPIIYSHKPLRDREPNDFYATQEEFVYAHVKDILDNWSYLEYPKTILDPGYGTGVYGKVLREFLPYSTIVGVDINGKILEEVESYYDYIFPEHDFLEWKSDIEFDLVIGNPPYRFAHEFINKSFELTTKKVSFLLRLAFLESRKRYNLYYSKGMLPEEVVVSVSRISFTGDGKSDNTAYAIFNWDKNSNHLVSKLRWLNWKH